MYLISAYFDEDTNKALERYIERISQATGNDFMVKNNVPPHLTISAIEARNVDVLREPFISMENSLRTGNIKIMSVGQLLPYVFYAAPVLNEYLQETIEMVTNQFKAIPETTISRYYRPGSWMPHITLGKTLNAEQMQQAFRVMQDSFQPLEAKITRLGLAKVNPHEDVEIINLKKSIWSLTPDL